MGELKKIKKMSREQMMLGEKIGDKAGGKRLGWVRRVDLKRCPREG